MNLPKLYPSGIIFVLATPYFKFLFFEGKQKQNSSLKTAENLQYKEKKMILFKQYLFNSFAIIYSCKNSYKNLGLCVCPYVLKRWAK